MAGKVTTMVLKVVDLQCPCCYKKIKKILCKFPQIRDQVYDEKGNTVTITVVCCDPEKVRDKLCCKGHRVIKSIDIKEPPKPKPPQTETKDPEKPKDSEKPKVIVVVEKPKEPEKPKKPEPKVVVVVEKPKEPEQPKKDPKPDPPKIPEPVPYPPMGPEPVMIHGPPPLYPVPTCCGECYGGLFGGPCYHGYGVPPPPQPGFDGYYGYGCGRGCGYEFGRDCHRCGYYSREGEENPSSCSVM